ncbi:PAS domain S-box protein [Salinilacihabitans rarus]|uniref:PAS domain S-box protein n=1 Tax=Salinilacihabitans rarus TaxID=2961596 RepID=UPI0020C8C301|nr:PAS domain S-box protein [Salinilacihabitans rarus]
MSERPAPPGATFWAETSDDVARQRYETLVNVVDDGIYQLDAAGRFEAVNDVILEQTGYDREALLGEHVSLVLAAADIEQIQREIRRRLTTGERQVETFEFPVRTAEGATIDCELRFSLLVEAGTFRGTVGIARDITDRKRTERTLAAREQQLQRERDLTERILDTAPIGIQVLDADGEITRLNERARELLDIAEPQAYAPSDRTVYDEDGRELAVDEHPFAQVLATGEPVADRILEIDRPDGDSRWLSVNAAPILTADGAVDRVVTTGEDVTALKEHARDLERRTDALAAELAEVYGRITDGVIAVNEAWEFTYANERAATALGLDTAEFLGETLWEAVPDVVDTVFEERFREAMATQEPVGVDAYYAPADKWFDAQAYPSATGLSIYVRDVTERAAAKREIEATNRTLQQLYAISADREQSFDEKVTRMLALGRERLGVETGYLATVDEAEDSFEVTHASSDDPRVQPGLVAPLSETYCRTTVETEGLLAFTDAPTDAGIDDESYETLGLECYIGGSVIVDGELYGTLCFEDASPRAASFTPAERTFVELVTQWVSYELERTQRRRTLEQYTEYTDAILDAVDDLFYVLDTDGRLRRWNESLAAVTGYTHAAIESMHALDFFDESAHEAITTAIADGLETGRTRVEAALQTADGATIPYEFVATTLTAPDGEPRLAGIGRDITERKRRDRELAKYEAIVETSNDGIYVADDALEYTMVNDAYAALTGYDRDELLGTHASRVVADETLERAAELREAMATEAVAKPTIEGTIETADGERVPVEVTFSTVSSDGTAERVGIVRDITVRKEQRRQLEASERRYRTLVEHFPNGAVALFDDDFRYTAVGGQLLDAMGVAPDDRVGTSVYDIYPDDIVDEVEPYFTAALAGEATSFDVEYRDRHLLAYTLPIRDAGDEIYAGMLVVQNITDLKETQRRLEESNERLQQFAYAASHDLQEPLRMVSSYLQLIEQRYGDALDADGHEFLAFAVDGAERMRAMIDGLLEYSRVETQGEPFEPVALEDVVEEARANLHVRIAETDARIEVADLPVVEGDPRQLRQLFQNLLSNAIEYSGDEPPQVHVAAERDGDEWTVSVRDEGIGIDPDEHDRIFEVFQRLHSRDEHPGTGIGLALCQRIVERHGGEIRVDSEPGEGTTFAVTLPAASE